MKVPIYPEKGKEKCSTVIVWIALSAPVKMIDQQNGLMFSEKKLS